MRALGATLAAAHPPAGGAAAYRDDPTLLDAELARAFLDVQRAELAAAHGPRGNPALWTGEAVFGAGVADDPRLRAARRARAASATARLAAVPAFLGPGARASRRAAGRHAMGDAGAPRLRRRGPPARRRRGALGRERRARRAHGRPVARRGPRGPRGVRDVRELAPRRPGGGGPAAAARRLYDGCSVAATSAHARRRSCCARRGPRWPRRAPTSTRRRARRAARGPRCRSAWPPTTPRPTGICAAFGRTWEACRARAAARDAVTWPDWPIRYVPYSRLDARGGAAPLLPVLSVAGAARRVRRARLRGAAASPPGDPTPHLRAWNHSAITLNHVVHHGAVGHHVQNWHAYHRTRSRVGRVAAVDCASRIGMFGGGTMAEGWACYATGLMEELGLPLAARAGGGAALRACGCSCARSSTWATTRAAMSFDEALRCCDEEAGMSRGGGMGRGDQVRDVPGDGAHVLARHRGDPRPARRACGDARAPRSRCAASTTSCSATGRSRCRWSAWLMTGGRAREAPRVLALLGARARERVRAARRPRAPGRPTTCSSSATTASPTR